MATAVRKERCGFISRRRGFVGPHSIWKPPVVLHGERRPVILWGCPIQGYVINEMPDIPASMKEPGAARGWYLWQCGPASTDPVSGDTRPAVIGRQSRATPLLSSRPAALALSLTGSTRLASVAVQHPTPSFGTTPVKRGHEQTWQRVLRRIYARPTRV